MFFFSSGRGWERSTNASHFERNLMKKKKKKKKRGVRFVSVARIPTLPRIFMHARRVSNATQSSNSQSPKRYHRSVGCPFFSSGGGLLLRQRRLSPPAVPVFMTTSAERKDAVACGCVQEYVDPYLNLGDQVRCGDSRPFLFIFGVVLR